MTNFKPFKTLVIEVTGGVVSDVLNLPPGWDYYVIDYDNGDEADETVTRQTGQPWICPVCNYEVHAPDGFQSCPNCNVRFNVTTASQDSQPV